MKQSCLYLVSLYDIYIQGRCYYLASLRDKYTWHWSVTIWPLSMIYIYMTLTWFLFGSLQRNVYTYNNDLVSAWPLSMIYIKWYRPCLCFASLHDIYRPCLWLSSLHGMYEWQEPYFYLISFHYVYKIGLLFQVGFILRYIMHNMILSWLIAGSD